MRALRVMGLAESGKTLVCEDPSTGEQFSVPCDDRLRAGARGDLSRFGQLEIELESQLRPREIQSRIRAGATVEQVAALAGTTNTRVERFAYPVLLERASVAEKAQQARPAIDGITAAASVRDTVTATLAARGHDGTVSWDAFKDDEGWILALTWAVGRSENRAHWLFHPGPDGGTLSARDEAAAEIVDPALRILRPLRPVRPEPAHPLSDPTPPAEVESDDESTARSSHPAGSKLGVPSGERPSRPIRQSDHQVERLVEDTVTDERAGANPVTRPAVVRTGTDSTPHSAPTTKAAGSTAAIRTPAAKPAAAVPAAPPTAAPAPAPAKPTSGAKPARRAQRPAMPSWEDVLLGTRSTNGH